MAEEEKKPAEGEEKKKSGGGGGIGIVMALLSAVLAGGAAFGGAKLGAAQAGEPAEEEVAEDAMPGPTINLEPFVVTITDSEDKVHAMKVTLAIELKFGALEDEMKPYVPRVRDAALTYLRKVEYKSAGTNETHETIRADLLAKFQELGVGAAVGVLITEFALQ